MASVSPHPREADWHTLVLGKKALPGVWTVRGVAQRRIDVKTRRDSDAARIKDQGYSPAEITITGQFASIEEWSSMVQALESVHPRRKGAAKDPLAIVHPAVRAIGIRNVLVVGMHLPEASHDAMVEQQIDLLEWVEQPKKVAKKKPRPISSVNHEQTLNREFTHPISGQTKIDTGFGFPSMSVLEQNPTSPLSELQSG